MAVTDNPDFDIHEDVRTFDLDPQGVRAIIAIHSTSCGPAAGGCRVWRYQNEDLAVSDALRLSRGMSYKNAMAGLPFGGGKSVIMLPAGEVDRQEMFASFGRTVDSLGGRYITAEDVGSTVADMQVVRTQTPYVGGLPAVSGCAGGDPSPWTALGVFASIQAVVNAEPGRSMRDVKVAVQGAGAVGADLCRRLAAAGAQIVLADINVARAKAVAERFGAYLVAPEYIHKVDCDVYAPCALGGGLNRRSVEELHASIVCGAANNQLVDPGVGDLLHDRGVLYCPDYVVNAGGIIAIYGESVGDSGTDVGDKVLAIPERLMGILGEAAAERVGPEVVADRIARARIGPDALASADDRTSIAGRP